MICLKPDDLKTWILSLTQDISFTYIGVSGSICPFTRQDISVSYGNDGKDYDNIEAVMTDPFIGGKSLSEISEQIQFD